MSVEPFDVQPRWFVHGAFAAALLAVVVAMAMLRRTGLDFDEDVSAAVVLALSFWIFAIALGSLVRNALAGYALRLDAAGLHIPGLEVVPWTAVRAARLVDESNGKHLRQIEVTVEAGYSGAMARHYERYLFGPVAGLLGPRDTIAIPVRLLAIAPNTLVAKMRAFIAGQPARDEAVAAVKAPRRQRRPSRRPSP